MHSDQVEIEVRAAVQVHQEVWVPRAHLGIPAHLVYLATLGLLDHNLIYSHSWIKFRHLKVDKRDLHLTPSPICKPKLDQWGLEDLQVCYTTINMIKHMVNIF